MPMNELKHTFYFGDRVIVTKQMKDPQLTLIRFDETGEEMWVYTKELETN